MNTPLATKMVELAKSFPQHADELRDKAQAFDDATLGYYGTPQTVDVQRFMGCYARARLLYCKLTGENLV